MRSREGGLQVHGRDTVVYIATPRDPRDPTDRVVLLSRKPVLVGNRETAGGDWREKPFEPINIPSTRSQPSFRSAKSSRATTFCHILACLPACLPTYQPHLPYQTGTLGFCPDQLTYAALRRTPPVCLETYEKATSRERQAGRRGRRDVRGLGGGESYHSSVSVTAYQQVSMRDPGRPCGVGCLPSLSSGPAAVACGCCLAQRRRRKTRKSMSSWSLPCLSSFRRAQRPR